MSALIESYDPDLADISAPLRAAAVGIYAEFRGIVDELDAHRQFDRLKPARQHSHIAEAKRYIRDYRRHGGRI